MAQCLECPEGFYCTSASTNYADCPAGGSGRSTHSSWDSLGLDNVGLADVLTAIWSEFVLGLGCMVQQMSLVKALKLFGIQLLSEQVKW